MQNIKIDKLFPIKENKNGVQIIITDEVPSTYKDWAKINNFNAESGQVLMTIDNKVIVGKGDLNDIFYFADIYNKLPDGEYIEPNLKSSEKQNLIIGWALSAYNFDSYKSEKTNINKSLYAQNDENKKTALSIAQGIYLCRDMINTPANDMTPQDIENQVVKLANQFEAETNIITGSELEKSYPLIHAVGKASINKPRLIELNWGNAKHPHLHLIGKGISFDSGGLDLKPSNAMLLMKKDMGGAGNIIGLAHIIMANKLPVRLKVLIPSAENMVSENSFRPMDILKSRKGITVEVGNTDAEGRLVLADALTYAGQNKNQADLTIDMATLTGAARIAVGADMPAFFCDDDKIANEYYEAGVKTNDPVWRMPLHKPYKKLLDTPNADISSCSQNGLAGAITAGLFLQEFVNEKTNWIHIDLMAYNNTKSVGKPIGGEAMGIRALWELLKNRYQ
jgi:leucyl aminopeptidase